MRKIVPVLVILALLAGGFYAFRAYRQQQNATAFNNLQTVRADRGQLTATVGATGTVRANQTAILAWQTTGIVDQVNVQVGDQVEGGQELASLRRTSLPQNVILAQADLVSSQKALDDLISSDLNRAQARQNLETAQQALDDLGKNTSLAEAQARDAYLKAQQVYSDTLELRQSLDFAADSQKVREARQSYEDLLSLVDQLRNIYNSLPGTTETNPEKARAWIKLRQARFQLEQAERLVKLYGGEPTNEQYERADANLELAEAQLEEARLAWERLQDGPDPAERALLEAQLAEAQRQYDRVKDGPDADEIAALEARIAAAQATLNLARLEAPFTGIATQVEIKPGDQTNPGIVAFRLDDLSHLLVDVSISEVDINRIRVGQPVSMAFDAILNQDYTGTVIEVAQVGTVVQGVVEFLVTVVLTDADQAVRPGMTAAVNVVVEQLDDVLLVPNRAVRVQDGQRVVYVLRDGVLEPEPVTLGASSDVMSEVLDGGLQVGDEIVLNPPQVFDTNGPPPFMRR
jgi:HlyD family secretion protein